MQSKRFAALLKQKRTNLHLSQSQVAKQCFIAKSSYNHFERGIRLPSLETLIRLGNVLKTDPSEFIYAIISEGTNSDNNTETVILEESSPLESSYKRRIDNSFELLDQYQQKAVMDIIDSIISTNANNIK